MEDKASRNGNKNKKNKPNGRAISYFQQLQMMLGYPEVRTDLRFENIPTVPLEQRPGIEVLKKNNSNLPIFNNDEISLDEIADQYDTSNPCVKIREEKGFPEKRFFTDSQLLIIQGTTNSSISIDKISVFGMRCPELLKS